MASNMRHVWLNEENAGDKIKLKYGIRVTPTPNIGERR